MIFNSIEFFFFFIIVFSLYWAIRRWYKIQNLLIVIASYLFYAWWNWRFLIVLFGISITTYISGYLITQSRNPTKKRIICAINVVLCVFVLGIFKYFDFFVGGFEDLLNLFGLKFDRIVSQLVLPIGISFYSFKCISYTVDVYKNKFCPSGGIVAFFAYVSFFPQLMAGPIDRASDLLSQFNKSRFFCERLATDGCRQMLWGFFKKVVIADNCQMAVSQIWGGHFSEPGYVLIIVAFLYSIQIYCDFSGYSDIAIGSAKLFGIKLTRNFKYPYFSKSLPDFWRNWHISLMSWLKDYIYIPLGGSRCKEWKIYRNIFIVWILSGLWHGADWTFVVWGVYHALLLIVYRLIKQDEFFFSSRSDMRIFNLMKMTMTFFLITMGWILFSASSISDAYSYVYGIFSNPLDISNALVHLEGLNLTLLVPAILLLQIIEWINRKMDHGLQFSDNGFMAHSRLARYSAYIALVMIIISYSDTQLDFIYFRF